MDERLRFIAACLEDGETMSALCRQFGISRKTGYRWLGRYEVEGLAGLRDRSRAPHTNSRALADAVVGEVLAVRQRHPTWGPRKVKVWLEDDQGSRSWPPASSIGNLFDRAGLTRPRKRRQRTPPQTRPFAACRQANDVWCVDFKGWFLTGDGIQVDPFTMSDAHSRYLLRCEVVARTDQAHVWPHFESAFREFGLPKAVRSDNGPPFASRGAAGLSRLAVKLIKAGILPERIAPGKPQQNGRHERMHLTLKQDTASPPAASLAAQLVRFREFQWIYNHERPHEALGQQPPARVYQPSPRVWDGCLRSPDYPDQVQVRRVRGNGEIKWKSRPIFITNALIGEPVGLYEIAEDTWQVKYGPIPLVIIKGRDKWKRS
jgi:transposase InsO family protein